MRIAIFDWTVIGALVLGACGGAGDPAAGERLYHQQSIGRTDAPGCITCHSTQEGERRIGPSHAGLASQAAERIRSPDYTGTARTAEEYLRESILQPNTYIVPGYLPDVMFPRYQAALTGSQVDDLVAYLLTLE